MSVPNTLNALLAPSNEGGASVVFDIDNTIADTRYRTLEVARAFDAEHASSHFGALTLDRVGYDGEATARALGLPPEIVQEFQEYWCSANGFWCGAHFASDRPIELVADVAREAQANGLVVIWLTGRIEELRQPTECWLARHELPRGELMCKPSLSRRTAAYKVDALRALAQRVAVRFFMTESRRDIAAVQSALPELCCVLLEFPFPESVEVHPETLCLSLGR